MELLQLDLELYYYSVVVVFLPKPSTVQEIRFISVSGTNLAKRLSDGHESLMTSFKASVLRYP